MTNWVNEIAREPRGGLEHFESRAGHGEVDEESSDEDEDGGWSSDE